MTASGHLHASVEDCHVLEAYSGQKHADAGLLAEALLEHVLVLIHCSPSGCTCRFHEDSAVMHKGHLGFKYLFFSNLCAPAAVLLEVPYGFKGYRFIGKAENKLPFSDFLQRGFSSEDKRKNYKTRDNVYSSLTKRYQNSVIVSHFYNSDIPIEKIHYQAIGFP